MIKFVIRFVTGNVPDGTLRGAPVHACFCDGGRWRPCQGYKFRGPFLPAFVVPKPVRHQGPPQDQEDHQAG